MELEKSGLALVDHARKASEEIGRGNIGVAKAPLKKAEEGAGKHMKRIA